eukprot:Protomagalhaensia_wolfi_Nauph_80__147@NODE_1083_length_1749_cov_65_021637_g825_i0_p1_GENE_NODE_1083_length_1749_cov_65_021637_g825_i0NODE_1083_length_1749_cov_65_021637_g825_i0_p1_ORF_typecomplete_len254_score34_53TBCC/PF07986_12/2_4e02TBCC/PF07986_12/1_4e16CAP_C/PF08603_11/0_12_NODE_1083_length_1749_cov_65_021637_g825_i09411702
MLNSLDSRQQSSPLGSHQQAEAVSAASFSFFYSKPSQDVSQSRINEINARMLEAIQSATSPLLSPTFDATNAAVIQPKPSKLRGEEHELPSHAANDPLMVPPSGDHLVYSNVVAQRLEVPRIVESVRIQEAQGMDLHVTGARSAISLEDVKDSTVVACCRQLRLSDCTNLKVAASVQTPPICEGCSDLEFYDYQPKDETTRQILTEAGMSCEWGNGLRPMFLDVPLAQASSLYVVKKGESIPQSNQIAHKNAV